MKQIESILQVSEDVLGPVTQSLAVEFVDGEQKTMSTPKTIRTFFDDLRKIDPDLATQIEATFSEEIVVNTERFLYRRTEIRVNPISQPKHDDDQRANRFKI